MQIRGNGVSSPAPSLADQRDRARVARAAARQRAAARSEGRSDRDVARASAAVSTSFGSSQPRRHVAAPQRPTIPGPAYASDALKHQSLARVTSHPLDALGDVSCDSSNDVECGSPRAYGDVNPTTAVGAAVASVSPQSAAVGITPDLMHDGYPAVPSSRQGLQAGGSKSQANTGPGQRQHRPLRRTQPVHVPRSSNRRITLHGNSRGDGSAQQDQPQHADTASGAGSRDARAAGGRSAQPIWPLLLLLAAVPLCMQLVPLYLRLASGSGTSRHTPAIAGAWSGSGADLSGLPSNTWHTGVGPLKLGRLASTATAASWAVSTFATSGGSATPSSPASISPHRAVLQAGTRPHSGAAGGQHKGGAGGPGAWPMRRPVGTHAAGGGTGGGPLETARRWQASSAVRVLAVVPFDAPSPHKATWGEVMNHMVRRLAWTDPSFQLILFDERELAAQGTAGDAAWQELTQLAQQGCQVFFGGALSTPTAVERLSAAAKAGALPAVRVFLGDKDTPTPPSLAKETSLKGYAPQAPSGVDQALSKLLSWSGPAKAAALWTTVQDLWTRHTSDDLLFVLLVLINEYVTPVDEVSMTTKGFDLPSLFCMVTNCGKQIMDCVSNPTCKGGLDCLQGCSFNDQVCQYRCIVSHETPQFEAFSLCILHKHNCRSLNAQPPMRPEVAPMASFRGAPLTHEAAEGMLLGWMTPDPGLVAPNQVLPFSWLVAAGKNPAYDFFPCQHQLFTRGKGKGVLWYEPVFKAITLDGRQVWRRRRYRVKRGAKPGTFQFTVLDNGVTSNEFWRIVDCDEAYEWCLFYYSGAASAAGLSYSGAVLGTRDGAMPTSPQATARLEAALEAAGIRTWELSFVDNTACAGAPLELSPA